MKYILLLTGFSLILFSLQAQNKLTPEQLWKLGRVSGLGMSKNNEYLIYSVSTPNLAENKSARKLYLIARNGGESVEIKNTDSFLVNSKISPDGKFMISSEGVKLMDVKGSEKYADLQKSNVFIYNSLNYRHWDTWEDGKFDHVFVAPMINGKPGTAKDIMPGEPYDSPQKPFGGDKILSGTPIANTLYMWQRKKRVLRMQPAPIQIYMNTI